MNVKANFASTVDLKPIQRLMGRGDQILVGYPSGRPHGELQTDELARILTYGTADIPPRPFLEEGIFEKKNEISQLIGEHYSKRVEGAENRPGLKRIGAEAVGAVQEFVRGDYYKETVPNSPETIRRKSTKQNGQTLVSDKPLIDTADMINATTYVVREGVL